MHGTNNMLLMVFDVQCTLTQPGCMKNAASLPKFGQTDPLVELCGDQGREGSTSGIGLRN